MNAKDQSELTNRYAKKYMTNKTRPVIKDELIEALTNIRNKRELKSTNETLKYLLDIERDLSKKQMILEIAKCPDCGEKMSVEHVGKIHDHIDKDSECIGCIQKTFVIEPSKEERQRLLELATEHIKKTEMQRYQIDANDKNSEQTEQKVKTQREIDEELWKSHNVGESALRMLRINKGYEKDEEVAEILIDQK